MPLTSDIDAAEFVRQAVEEFFKQRRRPIPGSILKLDVRRRAAERGADFDEKAKGFERFVDFVESCSGITVERRAGTDFLALPAGEKLLPSNETVTPSEYERIRQDFWFAFVSFPIPRTRRIYDPARDAVVYEEDTVPLASGSAVITPIPEEHQIAWRVEFAAGCDAEVKDELARALASSNPLRDFSVHVRRQPKVQRAWNTLLRKKVVSVIADWAAKNNVPKERWLLTAGATPVASSARAQLYQLLDRIPLEQLLELRVPLKWFVRETPKT